MSKTKTDETTSVDIQLRNTMARIMWDVDVKGEEFSGISDRNEKYAEKRDSYQRRAAAVVRQLMKRGVVISMAPEGSSTD